MSFIQSIKKLFLKDLQDVNISGTPSANQVLAYDGSKWGNKDCVLSKTFDIEVQFNNNYYSTGNNIENETGIALNKIVGVMAYSYNTIPLVCNVSNTGVLYAQRFDKSIVTETKTFTFIVFYKL